MWDEDDDTPETEPEPQEDVSSGDDGEGKDDA